MRKFMLDFELTITADSLEKANEKIAALEKVMRSQFEETELLSFFGGLEEYDEIDKMIEDDDYEDPGLQVKV